MVRRSLVLIFMLLPGVQLLAQEPPPVPCTASIKISYAEVTIAKGGTVAEASVSVMVSSPNCKSSHHVLVSISIIRKAPDPNAPGGVGVTVIGCGTGTTRSMMLGTMEEPSTPTISGYCFRYGKEKIEPGDEVRIEAKVICHGNSEPTGAPCLCGVSDVYTTTVLAKK